MKKNKITIFGAGLSGLVAAINLTKSGFFVEVREKMPYVGGDPDWHPSVHQQSFDLVRTAEFIGIDITGCFKRIKQHAFDIYGKHFKVCEPANSFVCEKGSSQESLESFLYAEAKKAGIAFVFNSPLGASEISRGAAIIATGLEPEGYRLLGIRHLDIQGYRAVASCSGEPKALSCIGTFTNGEFAYSASTGSTVFSLIFSRKGITRDELDIFKEYLIEKEGVRFQDWRYSRGAVPMEKSLTKKGVVLAGTISGMIDPFYLNGISGALVSGKIAALYFIDKNKAAREFDRATSNFYLKQRMQNAFRIMPFKAMTLPLLALVNSRFKTVGVI